MTSSQDIYYMYVDFLHINLSRWIYTIVYIHVYVCCFKVCDREEAVLIYIGGDGQPDTSNTY